MVDWEYELKGGKDYLMGVEIIKYEARVDE